MNESVPHPILAKLGCRVSHGNGTPEEQARNFLRSLREATIHQIAGRVGPDLTDAEYRGWLAKLEAWEAVNFVNMPAPIYPVGHRVPAPKPEPVKAAPPVQENPPSRWPTWPDPSTKTQH